MNNRLLAIVALLFAAIVASQVMVYRLAREVGRLGGKLEVYESFAARPDDGTCYTKKGGC